MRLRSFLSRLVLCVLSFSIVFLGVSINVSAETYTKMSGSQMRSLIGDTIPFTYTIDNVEYSASFTYASTIDFQYAQSVMGFNVSDNSVFGSTQLSNYDGLLYIWNSGFQSATSLYNIDIRLNMSFSGGARGGFMAGGLGSATPSNMTTALNAISNGGNYIGGIGNSSIITGNIQADASLADYYGIVSTSTNPSIGDTFRPLYYDGTDIVINHVYYNRIRTFSYNYHQYLFLYVVSPYFYGNYSVSTQDTTTTTTGTSSGDINVNVTVDNTETNSLLSDIWDSITGLVSGIAHLFIPDDDYIENWLDDMGDVISDAFTDKVNISVLKDLLLDLGTYGNTSSIRLPDIPIGNSYIVSRSVPLKPDGFSSLFEFVEMAINLVCTIWVFNMVLLRIKAVFVGEQVVEVEGDVE